MNEDSFAFVIHPIDAQRDVARKFPRLGRLPSWLIEFLSVFFPPVFLSEVKGIRSMATGRQLHGWLLACPLTPGMMLRLPAPVVYRKIVQTGRLAEDLGARILGLGAFTSVVGDGGITVSRKLSLPVTTGDSYTVATATRAVLEAAGRLGIDPRRAVLAVVGASGTIGSVCARLLAPRVNKLILVGRSHQRLQPLAQDIFDQAACQVVTTEALDHLREAQLIITVTSTLERVIEPEHLRSGAIVCDVARPRDVSRRVTEERKDVLVIEGGMIRVPGEVDFGFNFGFPPGMAYACMAETMALALERRYEPFTLGKALELSRVRTIDRIAHRHGFRVEGFRRFEGAVSETELRAVQMQIQADPVRNGSEQQRTATSTAL